MEPCGAYLDVSQGTAQDTQVGRLLLVHVGDVLFQHLKALLQMCPSEEQKEQTGQLSWAERTGLVSLEKLSKHS